MRWLRHALAALAIITAAAPAFSADLNCHGPANVEEFRYSWRLRGGLRWIAGLVFPTTGVGNLKTTFPSAGEHAINSELLITAPEGKGGGFFAYESQMDESGSKTLMTYSGYAWGKKSRNERTLFDYVKKLARIHKVTDHVEDRVKPLPAADLRDILTAIYFLRQNAPAIRAPITTTIYTDGKAYPVIFRPIERKQFVIENRRVNALGFEIVDAPGGKQWSGGVKVWLTEDARRIPCRIDISQSMASLQLDLESIEACSFMSASR